MKVLMLANFGMGLYNFRKEKIKKFLDCGFEVFVSLPRDEYVSKLEDLGCNFIETKLDRRGTNLIKDLRLLLHYMRTIKKVKPDIVLTYTIKPNVYGGMACAITKTPYIANVTGLGHSFERKGFLQILTTFLYKVGMSKAACIFFQNQSNQSFFLKQRILKNQMTRLIPGSGVNLDEHCYEEYPEDDENVRFLFVGRIMQAKGINELLSAAKIIKVDYPHIQFELVGFCEEDYSIEIEELESKGIIKYHGQQTDVHSFIKNAHAVILPSYHEGLSNVLLESASTGRPVLASRVPGCLEAFDDNVSGLGFEARSVDSLVDAIKTFIEIPYEKKKAMGISGREKMEREFGRSIVIKAYLDEINTICGGEYGGAL